ncbi:MAG: hypothetical protein N4A35_07170 [Flavobacteriales bacterium]|jgi:hypothetical protein|nr:hypothetical protein [Flavobacteriales bacterium]
MKKIIFYSVAIAAISMTSCAKEYDCKCEVEHKQSGQGFNDSYKFEKEITIKAKEKSADDACGDLSYTESRTDAANYKQEIIQKCDLK